MSKSATLEREPNELVESGQLLLRAVQRFNLLLSALLVLGAALFSTVAMMKGVLAGAFLAATSFYYLRRDIELFISNFSRAGEDRNKVKKSEKIKIYLKFYGRLAVLGCVIAVLITKAGVDVIGLVVGLSTTMLSVIVVVLSKGRLLYSAQR
ncbi:MAG: ATP synthase subunit I [Desulfobulbaceae bacterium]|nr:ATP synthase subunit I [Desulfobulbaceae bacterium]